MASLPSPKSPARMGSGQLYYMLSNPIYTGRVRHGEAIYAGEHEAIISNDLFEKVQPLLADQAQRPRGSAVQPDIHLLTELLVDRNGDRLKPTHATKAGKRYRYYISSSLLKAYGSDGKTGMRLPASELEALVVAELRKLFSDHPLLANWIVEARQGDRTEPGLAGARAIVVELAAQASPDRLRTILRSVLYRIEVSATTLKLFVDRGEVLSWLIEEAVQSDGLNGRTPNDDEARKASGASTTTCRGSSGRRRSSKQRASEANAAADLHVIEVAMSIRRRGVERRLVIEGQGALQPRFDRPLIDTIGKAHVYLEALNDGRSLNRKQVADEFGVHAEDISRLLPLTFLSPHILGAILAGHQPADLSVSRLTREIDLPTSWAAQSKLLGF